MPPARCAFQFIAIVLLLLNMWSGSDAIRWTDSLVNNTVSQFCAGLDVDLNWNFVTDPGEEILQITWTFHGTSSEVMAIVTHGAFYAMPVFAHRVSYLREAGLRVRRLRPDDRGLYAVEVQSRTVSGGFSSETKAVTLSVGEPPSVDEGVLWIRQEMDAVIDSSTGTAHIQLSCGHFSSRGEPPVQIVWRTPWGTLESSTSYENGDFHLALPNPFTAGQFQCLRDPAISDCLSGSSELMLSTWLEMDVDQARQTLLAASLGPAYEENRRLRQEFQELLTASHYIEELENVKLQLLAGSIDACAYSFHGEQTTTLPQISTDNNTAHALATFTFATATTSTAATTIASTSATTLTAPTTEISTTQQTSFTSSTDPCVTDEYIYLDDDRRDVNNPGGGLCDNTLPEGWYRFFLHNADAYLPTSCVSPHRCGTSAGLWLDLQNQTLPAAAREAVVSLCQSSEQGCCDVQPGTAIVRNCGSFYLYYLRPTECLSGSDAYCATSVIS